MTLLQKKLTFLAQFDEKLKTNNNFLFKQWKLFRNEFMLL